MGSHKIECLQPHVLLDEKEHQARFDVDVRDAGDLAQKCQVEGSADASGIVDSLSNACGCTRHPSGVHAE